MNAVVGLSSMHGEVGSFSSPKKDFTLHDISNCHDIAPDTQLETFHSVFAKKNPKKTLKKTDGKSAKLGREHSLRCWSLPRRPRLMNPCVIEQTQSAPASFVPGRDSLVNCCSSTMQLSVPLKKVHSKRNLLLAPYLIFEFSRLISSEDGALFDTLPFPSFVLHRQSKARCLLGR